MPVAIFLKGFSLGAGLIIAIGAQNALVLRHGLKKQHHLIIPTLCFFIDVTLITLGVSGAGIFFNQYPEVLVFFRWAGAVFLFLYGMRAFYSAINKSSLSSQGGVLISRKKAILTTLAVSLLNPHVYLDTVLLLGSIGGQFSPESRVWFILGAILASFIWFYSLSLIASRLASVFSHPRAWQILDCIIGLTMWTIAVSLIV